jgi:VanZ family protein
MKKIASFARKYIFSLICIALIWYLSIWFMALETPLNDVEFMDKWTHLVMYGGTCSVIWWEYLKCHDRPYWPRLLLWAWLAPIVMSGCIELIQEYCTIDREGEWYDLAANVTGATLGNVIGLLMLMLQKRR